MKWPLSPLGKLSRMVGGGTPSKKNGAFWEGGTIPWVSPKDMGNHEIHEAKDHISDAAVEGSATQVVPAGSVLVVVRSGILVRRFPIAIARVPVAINQDMKALLPGGPLNPEFLAYALESRAQDVLYACVKRGATVHSIDIGKFQNLKLPVPAPSEQRRIVEILDQADSLRKLRSEADAKAERILPALFNKMFGDPATNPMGWPVGELGEVVVETQYGTSIRANTSKRGVVVLRMNNITRSGQMDLTNLKHVELPPKEQENYLLRSGDILFNRTNSADLVGKTGIWKSSSAFDAVPASYLIRTRVDEQQAVPEFIWAFMNTPFIKQVILNKARRAIGMSNINAKELRKLPLVLPSLPMQTAFVERIAEVEETVISQMKASSRIQQLFSVLLHRTFTGDLTASWRELHKKELLQEMEQQAKMLEVP